MRDGLILFVLVGLLLLGFVGGKTARKNVVYTQGIMFEWSVDVNISNVFTVALLKDGPYYDVVAGNGSYISIVNGSGYLKSIIDVGDNLNISDTSVDMGFGYLGSNITHVYTTVIDVKPLVSINGDGYAVDVYIFFVSNLKSTESPKAEVFRSINNLPRLDIPFRLEDTKGDVYKRLIPTIRAFIGNLTGPVYSASFFAGSSFISFIKEDSKYVNINCECEEFGFTTGHVLSWVDGDQLVFALNDTNNGDLLVVYTLSEDSVDNIYINYNYTAYKGNISYTGYVPDVATADIDRDKIEEIIIDNTSGIIVLEEGNNTKNDGILSVKFGIQLGVVDRLMIGNFSGDPTPEFIFYDPTDSMLEVWNSTSKVYYLPVDGDPVADIVLCELDGDGYVDIFLLTNTTAYLVYGGGQYEYIQLPAEPTSNGLIADIDGDTYLEMIFVANSTMYCYQTSFTKIGNRQLLDSYAKRTLILDGNTDLDGLNDWEEVYVYCTSPYNPDTDGDGFSDWEEIYVCNTSPTIPNVHCNNAENNTSIVAYIEAEKPQKMEAANKLSSIDICVPVFLLIFSSALLMAVKKGKKLF